MEKTLKQARLCASVSYTTRENHTLFSTLLNYFFVRVTKAVSLVFDKYVSILYKISI